MGEALDARQYNDLGATIADNFSIPLLKHGVSFLKAIK